MTIFKSLKYVLVMSLTLCSSCFMLMPLWFVPPYLYFNLADQYYNKCNYDQAIKYYNKALNIMDVDNSKCDDFLADVFMRVGFSYNQLGEYTKSNDNLNYCYSKIKESPDKTISEKNRKYYLQFYSYEIGENYNRLGDYQKAIIYLKDAIFFDPKSANAFREIGFASIKVDKIDEGTEYFEESIRLDASKDNMHKIQSYLSNYPSIEEKVIPNER